MPIEVKAVSKDDFQHWLTEAKKKFARRDEHGNGVRVAVAAGQPDAAALAPAGN
jgi:heme/copper-type cytochrome/quinol oxidase subunit 2